MGYEDEYGTGEYTIDDFYHDFLGGEPDDDDWLPSWANKD